MNFKNITKKINLFVFVSLIGITTVFAADLKTAKSAGLIGEQADGYLGLVVATAPADVKALVADVNQKRKKRYQEVANKQKVSLSKIEKVAGEKAFEKTALGNFIQINNKWVKK